MKKRPKRKARIAKFHAVNTGRRVAKRDKELSDLIEFANLLTPRLTAQSKLSHLQMINQFRHASDKRARLTPEQLEALWADERRDPTTRVVPAKDAQAAQAKARERLNELLSPIWIKALDRFGVPFTTSTSVVGQFGITETIQHPSLAVSVPGLPMTSPTPEDLIEKIWTVRSVLWRLALAQRQPEDQWRRPIPLPAPPKSYVLIHDGKVMPMSVDLTGMLVEKLTNIGISRLRICGVRYRRTRSRCCRLFLALTKKQRDCSRQCRDLRLHNFDRDLVDRARRLREEEEG
jgi:hypothetical protein